MKRLWDESGNNKKIKPELVYRPVVKALSRFIENNETPGRLWTIYGKCNPKKIWCMYQMKNLFNGSALPLERKDLRSIPRCGHEQRQEKRMKIIKKTGNDPRD